MELQTAKYWLLFKQLSESKYFDTIANERIKRIASLTKNELFSSPNMLFYGNDISILMIYIDAIVKRVFGLTSLTKRQTSQEYGSTKVTLAYKYTDVHIEVDMESMTSAERQGFCEYLSKDVATTKNIRQDKHVIVIHNMQTMSDNNINTLRKIVDSCPNVMFLMTSKSINCIDASFKSRCMLVRSNTEEDDLTSFFETFAEEHMTETNDTLDIYPSEGIVMNLLRMSFPYMDKTSVEHKIEAFIDTLMLEKDICKAYESIRVFGHNILHFGVTLKTIMTYSMSYINKKLKKRVKEKQITSDILNARMRDLVLVSAQLEAKSCLFAKPILIIEKYFLQIHQSLHT